MRPDEADRGSSLPKVASCRTDPAGESPAQVIAGEPGSRPPASGEIPVSEARCQRPRVRKLPRGQRSGPQRVVNAEQASSDSQPKGVRERGSNSPRVAPQGASGRAAHFTAKATDSALHPDGALELPGVLAAARFEGSVLNRRDPTRRLTSSEATRIRPTAESEACREGVRGGRSTDEGGDKPLEGRTPASVKQAQRRTRAWS